MISIFALVYLPFIPLFYASNDHAKNTIRLDRTLDLSAYLSKATVVSMAIADDGDIIAAITRKGSSQKLSFISTINNSLLFEIDVNDDSLLSKYKNESQWLGMTSNTSCAYSVGGAIFLLQINAFNMKSYYKKMVVKSESTITAFHCDSSSLRYVTKSKQGTEYYISDYNGKIVFNQKCDSALDYLYVTKGEKSALSHDGKSIAHLHQHDNSEGKFSKISIPAEGICLAENSKSGYYIACKDGVIARVVNNIAIQSIKATEYTPTALFYNKDNNIIMFTKSLLPRDDILVYSKELKLLYGVSSGMNGFGCACMSDNTKYYAASTVTNKILVYKIDDHK